MKDAKGHGSDARNAVAGVNRAAGTWAQGLINAHGTASIAAAHGIPFGHMRPTPQQIRAAIDRADAKRTAAPAPTPAQAAWKSRTTWAARQDARAAALAKK